MKCKHGLTRTPEWNIWVGIIDRCDRKTNRRYHRYGGRGIKLCDRWRDFSTFLSDMGSRPSSLHTVERINNDGGYEPSNCKWGTRLEQTLNRDVTLRDSDGVPLAELCVKFGINLSTLVTRYKAGDRGERLVREPKKVRGRTPWVYVEGKPKRGTKKRYGLKTLSESAQ